MSEISASATHSAALAKPGGRARDDLAPFIAA